MLKEIQEIVERGFTGKNIIVVGDLMLDKYLIGDVGRVSPEAPVPVLRLNDEKYTLGGAGNVALNLKGLNIDATLVSMVGNDPEARDIQHILDQHGLSSDYIFSSSDKPTITKTRIVGDKQQIVRVDKESTASVNKDMEGHLIESFQTLLKQKQVDAVILSDYAKGLMSPNVCRHIIDEANRKNIPVLVDPKGKDFSKYRHATILMPNDYELSLACGHEFHSESDMQKSGRFLFGELEIDNLVVTLGEKGILLIDEDNSFTIPTRAREVYDVSGAGDTVIALVAAGLAVSLPIRETLELANLAAGYVVSRFGTHPISYTELKDILQQHLSDGSKGMMRNELKNRLVYWRKNNHKIVFTNGCFDIIHAGHIHLLKEAKQQGDKLVVALNTDQSIKALKGDSRPVNSLEDRITVLEAISYVDAIVSFDEETPLQLISEIRPDVLVKGADYEEEEIAGAKEVKANGGTVYRVPLIEGKSTTGLLMHEVSSHG